jgi:ATPase subunit of ABC transporter with duplicated ATPase domains
MDAMLQVTDLRVEIGGKTTLERASFVIHAGDKVGLVGRNGAGKTTMFKTLGGEREAAGGTITTKGGFGYLPQDPKADPKTAATTALTYVLSGQGLDVMAERVEKLRLAMEADPSDRNVTRYSKALDEFGNAGGYSAESDVRRIIAGLGLSDERVDLPVGVLSGGERRRVELARILFAGSDMLLLDEPTNHIDIDAKNWLMSFLRSYRGALLVISHDLDLLDESINRVLHLDEGELHEYKGTYSQYKISRAKDEERLNKLADAQEADMAKLKLAADSMRGQTAKRAKVAKAMDRRIDQIQKNKVERIAGERKSAYRFPDPPHCGRVVLEVDGVSKAYGGPPIFEDVSFAIERGERLLILGLNGAGKTSLLRILANDQKADAGSFRLGMSVSAGYYAQEHEGIHQGVSVLDHLRRSANQPDDELRSLLGMFDLPGDKAFQDASTLSGGEKTKLALAQLVVGKHNLLLLDEPTNNLDPPSLEAIGDALAGWKGAMVVVSHDARFVERLAPQRVLMMPDGTLDYWSDDLIDLVEMA